MSKIEVNTIEPQCGTTLTVGGSGDTVALGSGASQTGFGRTGTVDWQTTPKTATFTAVNGEGYFCNTTAGAFEVDLPAGAAGSIVSVQDYNNTFDTDNLTIDPNGSEKINGGDAGMALTLSTEGQGLTLVYVDSTVGWRSVHSDDFSQVPVTPTYITATVSGTCNTLTTSGDYKTATFVNPGTFCVSDAGNPAGSDAVDYMIVAGGAAGGGKNNGGGVGGGGAGGVRIGTVTQPSPLSPASLIAPGKTVAVTGYPIVVGGGGACSTNVPNGTAGTSGDVSSGLCFTAAGGAGGNDATDDGGAGGSGGGGGEAGGCGGAGNTPPVSPAQGNPGGTGNSPSVGAGGGGFTVAGESSTPVASSPTGDGGAGIDAGPVFGTANGSPSGNFGGGGGASSGAPSAGPFSGGTGGGGIGNKSGVASTSGATNTGGGGGGHGSTGAPSGGTNAGGSGIVIIRYKFQ